MIQFAFSFFTKLAPHGQCAILFCCLLCGCTSSNERIVGSSEKKFFDLATYFQAEIDQLNKTDQRLKKEVTLNGSMETQVVEKVDFSEELKLFLEADINQVALMDKYRSDSIATGNELTQLTHTALDSSLLVRKIIVHYDRGEVDRVDVYKKQDSFVGSSQQHLHYEPGEGYAITSLQKTLLTKAQQLKIETSFD